jgi:hypothetical protein
MITTNGSQRFKHFLLVVGRYIPLMILLFALAIVAVVLADASTIDFENPPYTTGTIHGQDGWSKTGPYDAEVVTNSYGYGSFGSQSLRISNAVASGSFGDQTFSKSLVDEAGEASAVNDCNSGGTRQTYIEAQWDFS